MHSLHFIFLTPTNDLHVENFQHAEEVVLPDVSIPQKNADAFHTLIRIKCIIHTDANLASRHLLRGRADTNYFPLWSPLVNLRDWLEFLPIISYILTTLGKLTLADRCPIRSWKWFLWDFECELANAYARGSTAAMWSPLLYNVHTKVQNSLDSAALYKWNPFYKSHELDICRACKQKSNKMYQECNRIL